MNWIGVDKLNVLLIHPEVDRLLHEKPSWFTLGLTWFHWLWAADASPPSSFWPQSWCEGWGWTGQNTETQNVSGVALNNFPSHKWSFTKSKKKALVENYVLVFYFSLKRQNTSSGLKEKQVHLQHCTPLQTQTSPSESSSCRGRRSLAELPQYFQTPPANGWKMGTNWVNNIKNHQNHWEMSMCKQKSIWLYTNVARDTVSAVSSPPVWCPLRPRSWWSLPACGGPLEPRSAGWCGTGSAAWRGNEPCGRVSDPQPWLSER